MLDDQTLFKYLPNWIFKALGAKIPFEYILEEAKDGNDYSIGTLFLKAFRYFIVIVTLVSTFIFIFIIGRILLFDEHIIPISISKIRKDQLYKRTTKGCNI